MSKTTNFLNKIKPGAMQLWDKFGILPSVAAGQAALESAWGTSGLATRYNNLFGVKGNYKGNSAMMNTWEVYGGKRYDVKDSFRAYPDWATSILDYGVFLTVNKRYSKAIGLTDYKAQIRAIHNAGYATDPQYANKVISIIEKHNLDEWDKEVLKGKKSETKKSPKKETKKRTAKNGKYTVVAGDTLSEIAADFGVTVNQLVQWNNIKDKNLIRTGQVLQVQKPKSQLKQNKSKTTTYKIKTGDTLTGIAKKFGTTVEAIRKLNNITNPNMIYAGDTIKIPSKKPVYHKVKDGDTVSALAMKYGYTIQDIKKWNNLDSKYTIYAGTTIRVK